MADGRLHGPVGRFGQMSVCSPAELTRAIGWTQKSQLVGFLYQLLAGLIIRVNP